MDSIKNQRIAEYFIISMFIGIGVPISILWGYQDGERLAAKAYRTPISVAKPVVEPSTEMFLATASNIEMGRTLFQANCTACHGEHADGKGPAAMALTPPPRNFTDANAKWTRSREPRDIFKTVSEGSPGTAMPPFSASLSEEERWSLVHYVGSLVGVKGKFKPIDDELAKILAAEEK